MSAFRKAGNDSIKATPGSIISSHDGSQLVSSGIADLDLVLGGGIPIGHVLCFKEDRYTKYASLLVRCFASQTLDSTHALLFAGIDALSSLNSLPLRVASADNKKNLDDHGGEVDLDLNPALSRRSMGSVRDDSDRMKIAWRYQKLGQFSSKLSATGMRKGESSVPYQSTFDITKFMDDRSLATFEESGKLFVFPIDELDQSDDSYTLLYEKIVQVIDEGNYHLSSAMPLIGFRPILRIVIQSIATPYWYPKNENAHYIFLYRLKTLLRNSSACCVFSLPAYLYDDYYQISACPIIRAIEHLCDAVIEIESFEGTPRILHEAYTKATPLNPAYHGLIHPVKFFTQRSLLPATFRQLDHSQLKSLAFRVRRKRFTIETFHLPPEAGEDDESTVDDNLTGLPISSVGDGPGSSRKMDF